MPSWALPTGEGLAPCINPYVWLYAHGARTSLDSGLGCPRCSALLPPAGPGTDWVLCTKGGIDGNKQLRLVGQVLPAAYGKVLGIFPVLFLLIAGS